MHRVLLAAFVLLGLDIVPASPAWSQVVVFSDSFECIFFEDADADLFGNPLVMLTGCPRPIGFVHDDSDCDDGSIDTFPGAAPNDSAFACMRDLDFDDYGESNPPPQVMAGSDCDDLNVFLNPGATETCDGIDNNCNILVDENNAGGGQGCSTGLLGICDAGTTACDMGALQCLQNTMASADVCDDIDNNCDGSVDEDFLAGGSVTHTGLDGLVGVKGDACGSGACASGTVICGGNTFSLACDTEALSELELCDGIDNDCDGSVDDGNPGGGGSCSTGLPGVCSAGTTSCTGGALQCFQDDPGSPEICDGLDNDCNGLDDDVIGLGGPCTITNAFGTCPGILICGGQPELQCDGDIPEAELCDGLDNNCDGQIDEGCEIASVRIHFPSGAIMMSATGQLSIAGSVGQTPAGPADSGSGHHVYWGFRAGLEQ